MDLPIRTWPAHQTPSILQSGTEDNHSGASLENQIEEGDWVATSYTISEEHDDHMGIMISRIENGKIAESHVVARTVAKEDLEAHTPSRGRRAFN